MSLVVTLVVAGALVPFAHPPLLVAGHVLAPLDSLRRFASSTAVLPASGVIRIVRGAHTCTLHVDARRGECDGRPVALGAPAFVTGDGTAFVPLADLARHLGGTVAYDPARRVVGVAFDDAGVLATPSPYVAPSVTVAPFPLFTPQPQVTPRAIATGSPRPRRTAIPAVPSMPVMTAAPPD